MEWIFQEASTPGELVLRCTAEKRQPNEQGCLIPVLPFDFVVL
jgi:hypothetical protein